MSAPDKKNILVYLQENKNIAPGFFRMTVELSGAQKDFAPGQFFQLRLNPDSLLPLLRRPFAPDEVTDKTMSFVYAVVGEGTKIMSKMQTGIKLGLLYPLGKGYTIKESEKSQALLIGGGCGAPSLLPLAQKLQRNGQPVTMVTGAANKSGLLNLTMFKNIADKLLVATDDGSVGFKGNAVQVAAQFIKELASGEKPVIYACGPEAMLRGVTTLAEEIGVACEISLEARMACGFGACLGCVVKIKDNSRKEGFGYQKVCSAGPVFSAHDIYWD